jgi:hypothetical protein
VLSRIDARPPGRHPRRWRGGNRKRPWQRRRPSTSSGSMRTRFAGPSWMPACGTRSARSRCWATPMACSSAPAVDPGVISSDLQNPVVTCWSRCSRSGRGPRHRTAVGVSRRQGRFCRHPRRCDAAGDWRPAPPGPPFAIHFALGRLPAAAATHQSNRPRRHCCSKSEGIGPRPPYRHHARSKSDGTLPLLRLHLCSTSDGTLRYPRRLSLCSTSDGGFLPYRRRHCCSTSAGTLPAKCSIVSLAMGRPSSSELAEASVPSSERANMPVAQVTLSLFIAFSDTQDGGRGPMWLMPHRVYAEP